MSMEPRQQPALEQRIRAMQIIAGTLCLGVLVFGVIAVVVAQGRQPSDGLVAYIGAGLAAVMTVMRFVVSKAGASQAMSSEDSAKLADRGELQLLSVYQSKMIIELAMLEGAAFVNLVAYIIEVQTFSLVVAAVLLILMLTSFPSRTKVEHWLEGNRQIADWTATSGE